MEYDSFMTLYRKFCNDDNAMDNMLLSVHTLNVVK